METKDLKVLYGDDSLIRPMVANRRSFPSKRGAEGVAYFVGQEFVMKYFERINMPYHTFDNYAFELKKFADGGLSVPKIYSWAMSPINVEDGVYRYYILQERVAGEDLLPYSLNDVESRCMKFCSRKEFDGAIENIAENKALYNKMLNEFVSLMLERNKELASLSKEEIARFINTYFEINRKSVFSSPDLHPGNVLFDGNHMVLIDETMTFSSPNKWLDYEGKFKERHFKVETFYDLLYLFTCNRHIQSYLGCYEQETGEKVDRKILTDAKENKKVFGQFMKLWVSEGMKMFIPSEMTSLDIEMLYRQVDDLVDEKSARDILQQLQK